MPRRIAIVGASAAGLSAAEALRNKGYDGSLILVGTSGTPAVRPAATVQTGPLRLRGAGEGAAA